MKRDDFTQKPVNERNRDQKIVGATNCIHALMLGRERLWLYLSGSWRTSCAVIHALFLWKIAGALPFPTLGVPILLGLAEALVFVLLSAKITEMLDTGKIRL
jgi:hypothetical protein